MDRASAKRFGLQMKGGLGQGSEGPQAKALLGIAALRGLAAVAGGGYLLLWRVFREVTGNETRTWR